MNKIGLRNFDAQALQNNLDALIMALIEKKPESIKGRYFQRIQIKTTMGPSLKLSLDHYNQLST